MRIGYIGWKYIVDTYKVRKRGNKGCFVYVDFRSFLKGYSLCVCQIDNKPWSKPKRFFMFPWDFKDEN